MTYLEECVFQVNQMTWMLKYLIWSQVEMKIKRWWSIFHVIENAKLIVQLSVQVKNGIMKTYQC